MPVSFLDIDESKIKVFPAKTSGKVLLTIELDIRDKNEYGRNVLMIASKSGMKDIVKHCLMNIDTTHQITTPCTICQVKQNVNIKLSGCGHVFHNNCITKWYHEFDAKTTNPTCPNCKSEFTLNDIKHTFNIINEKDYKGNTALMLAVNNHHYDIVKMLIDFGCDINAIDKDGDTPLINAVMIQSYKIVKLLMDANADTTIENNMGRTVFSIAYNNRTYDESNKKIFQYIVSKGVIN